MARLPRLILPSQPHYVIVRGLVAQPVFQDEADYTAYLGWLRRAAKTFRVALHAYALLPDSVHLLLTPADDTGLGQMMQWLGRYYVPYFNQKYGRSGTLWQGRYKTSLIEAEPYFLDCCRYLESAPVRAGLAAAALDYPWSSHAHHTGQQADPGVVDHPLYWALGNTPFQREAAYLTLAGQGLPAARIAALEPALLKGRPLGGEAFQRALERSLRRQVLPAKRGRPFKRPAEPGGDGAGSDPRQP